MRDESHNRLPQGIQLLVSKASLDPVFNAILLRRCADAAQEIGLELTPAESAIITNIPADHLDAIIGHVVVHSLLRPIFLGKDGAAMVKALSAEIVEIGWGGGGSVWRNSTPLDQRDWVAWPVEVDPNIARPLSRFADALAVVQAAVTLYNQS